MKLDDDDVARIARQLKPHLEPPGVYAELGVNYVSIQKAAQLYGKSRSFLYSLREQEKLRFFKFEKGSRQASFIRISELEAALKPE